MDQKGWLLGRDESSQEEGGSDYHVWSLKKSCTALGKLRARVLRGQLVADKGPVREEEPKAHCPSMCFPPPAHQEAMFMYVFGCTLF